MTSECSSGYAPNECVLNGYYQIPQDLLEWMLGEKVAVELSGLPIFDSQEIPTLRRQYKVSPYGRIRKQTRRQIADTDLFRHKYSPHQND